MFMQLVLPCKILLPIGLRPSFSSKSLSECRRLVTSNSYNTGIRALADLSPEGAKPIHIHIHTYTYIPASCGDTVLLHELLASCYVKGQPYLGTYTYQPRVVTRSYYMSC